MYFTPFGHYQDNFVTCFATPSSIFRAVSLALSLSIQNAHSRTHNQQRPTIFSTFSHLVTLFKSRSDTRCFHLFLFVHIVVVQLVVCVCFLFLHFLPQKVQRLNAIAFLIHQKMSSYRSSTFKNLYMDKRLSFHSSYNFFFHLFVSCTEYICLKTQQRPFHLLIAKWK